MHVCINKSKWNYKVSTYILPRCTSHHSAMALCRCCCRCLTATAVTEAGVPAACLGDDWRCKVLSLCSFSPTCGSCEGMLTIKSRSWITQNSVRNEVIQQEMEEFMTLTCSLYLNTAKPMRAMLTHMLTASLCLHRSRRICLGFIAEPRVNRQTGVTALIGN